MDRFAIDLYRADGSGDCGTWVTSICDKETLGCKDSSKCQKTCTTVLLSRLSKALPHCKAHASVVDADVKPVAQPFLLFGSPRWIVIFATGTSSVASASNLKYMEPANFLVAHTSTVAVLRKQNNRFYPT